MYARPHLALALLLALPALAAAHSFNNGDITVGHPWTRATPGGTTTGAAYAKIVNAGKTADRLKSINFELADKVEIHEMKMEGDTMKMRALPDGIEIKPGETIMLTPSGTHMMLLNLKKPIEPGAVYKGAFVFEKAGPIDVEFKSEAVGAIESGDPKK